MECRITGNDLNLTPTERAALNITTFRPAGWSKERLDQSNKDKRAAGQKQCRLRRAKEEGRILSSSPGTALGAGATGVVFGNQLADEVGYKHLALRWIEPDAPKPDFVETVRPAPVTAADLGARKGRPSLTAYRPTRDALA